MSTPGELLEALGREARARLGGRDTATRVYRGRSVEELVPQIQRDLGSDAIILRRREGLTGGMFGFFQRAFVEIEAMPGAPGVDVYDETPEQEPAVPPVPAAPQYELPPAPAAPVFEPAPPPTVEYPPIAAAPTYPTPAPAPVSASPPPPMSTPEPPSPPPEETQPGSYLQRPGGPGYEPYPPIRSAYGSPPTPSPPVPSAPTTPEPFYSREPAAPTTAGASAYVTAHLAALARADRTKLPPRTAAPGRPADPLGWAAEIPELAPREQPQSFPSPLTRAPAAKAGERPGERRTVGPGSTTRAQAGVARSLSRCGIGDELARDLIEGASAHALALAPRAGLAQAVRTTLAQRIPVAPPLPTKGAAIVIVGAGGAGKTTCCAALLGAYRKSSSLSASCATIAREDEEGELRMLLSPYVMKPTPVGSTRALRALRKARGEGLAVVDTPSLSPSDRAGVRELAKLLAELSPERVVVALPATLGATAAAQLLQSLRPLGANALALTHADETDQFGVAVEAACRFGLAPEYMLERARGGGWRLRQLLPSVLAERLLP
jgi:SRP54-type protein, GTPase domain